MLLKIYREASDELVSVDSEMQCTKKRSMCRKCCWLIILIIAILVVLMGFRFGYEHLRQGHKKVQVLQGPNFELDMERMTPFIFIDETNGKPNFQEVLRPLLIPRASGTLGNKAVAQYIQDRLKSLGWTLEIDEFNLDKGDAEASSGRNIIATLDPKATRRLVFACHYDSSKHLPNFIGATDSAVPCAMLLYLAETLQESLELHRNAKNQGYKDVTIQLVFFDAHEDPKGASQNVFASTEAFLGSRHLADVWRNKVDGDGRTSLERIKIMILLHLLGTSSMSIPAYFKSTSRWHCQLHLIEAFLRDNAFLSTPTTSFFFRREIARGPLPDDHSAFAAKGVPVLQLVPEPIPSEYHLATDDVMALDWDAIQDFNTILRVFVAYCLELKPPTGGDFEKGDTKALAKLKSEKSL